ncbi:MAG: relaxase domain-containing protein [Phycisphaeraceae bacterium]|nr:relaxase domain-containing protein [Phycisphaerales bacterium]MCB9843703.1 relaxase domain-containing protein [Phycisphaeraceae bacterium]
MSGSAARAKSYYTTADYYIEGQEMPGVWRGKGAARLGLDGTVDRASWELLCDNRDPFTGKPLTVRRKSERRVGYDFNFHCPKSVSLLYGLTRDERILGVFRASVQETMQEIETESKARVRAGGRNEDRVTGNLVWGEFVHFTARPEGGVPDPHLHAHCFVFNATFDPDEARWKAGQFGDLKRDASYFEAVFHAKLAHGLEALGLETRRTGKGWELEGLDKTTLEKFSRRTARIEALAEARGITDPALKAELGALSRAGKVKSLGMEELEDLWRSRLTEPERSSLDAISSRIGGPVIDRDPRGAIRASERALEHCFERASVVPERAYLTEALRQGVGASSRQAIEEAALRQPLIHARRDGRRMVTTREVLDEEQRILEWARLGRGACVPINPETRPFHRDWLSSEQREAVRHVLSSRDRVVLIRGAAGTGKTSMMQEAREAIEEAGQRVFVFAPSASASRGVLRAEGFENAETVARLLADERLQDQVRGSVVWIDEAGLVGARTMRRVFDLAQRANARVVLTGDRRQHGSVERGAVLRLLEDEAGLVPAEIRDIKRQRDQYKLAVKDLSEGDVASGFWRLDRLGWIQEVGAEYRYRALAAAYVETVRSGKTALVVSPTHAEGDRITAEIRRTLREDGLLGKDRHLYSRLVPLNLTLGQCRDVASYEPGDVLVFHQNARGRRKGERLVVRDEPLPLDQAERFTVFRPSRIDLSVGDRIRATRNGTSADGHRVNNGDFFAVKGFTRGGDIELTNGWVLPRDYGHLDYGLVVTSHASQGKTVDHVLIGQSSQSFRASSREQFYVCVSRGREQAIVFTDDKHDLLRAVEQTDERLSGTELVHGGDAARRRAVHRQAVRRSLAAAPPAMIIQRNERDGVEHER